MKREKMRSKQAFTLAELLVVIAVIGILVAIAIPTFSSQLDKAREAACMANRRSALAAVSVAYMVGEETDLMAALRASGLDCPHGGSYSASMDATGTIIVGCTIHGGLNAGEDVRNKMQKIADQWVSDGKGSDNDKMCRQLWEAYGEEWPQIRVDGVVYSVRPHYGYTSGYGVVVFANSANTPNGSWDAPLYYNHGNQTWYRWDSKSGDIRQKSFSATGASWVDTNAPYYLPTALTEYHWIPVEVEEIGNYR